MSYSKESEMSYIDEIPNWSNWAIYNKVLVGNYPSGDKIKELEKLGVNYSYNMTSRSENLPEYHSDKIKEYKIECLDQKCPSIIVLVNAIKTILYLIDRGYLIYVHCRGGHGRSAILASILIGCYYQVDSDTALKTWKQYHDSRVFKGNKGYLPSPQRQGQINLVHKVLNEYLTPIRFNVNSPDYGFLSNFHRVSFWDSEGVKWKTSEHYFQAAKYKNTDPDFARIIGSQSTTEKAMALARKNKTMNYSWSVPINVLIEKYTNSKLRDDWFLIREEVLYDAIKFKFEADPKLKSKLVATYGQILIDDVPDDPTFSQSGRNHVGRALMRLRSELKFA